MSDDNRTIIEGKQSFKKYLTVFGVVAAFAINNDTIKFASFSCFPFKHPITYLSSLLSCLTNFAQTPEENLRRKQFRLSFSFSLRKVLISIWTSSFAVTAAFWNKFPPGKI